MAVARQRDHELQSQAHDWAVSYQVLPLRAWGKSSISLDFVIWEGKPLEEVLDAVLDKLCEDGGLLDDSALTEAMARTLDEISEDAETVEEFDALLSGRAENTEGYLQIYFANILAISFEQKEGAFVRDKVPREECDRFFSEARELIRTIVSEELSQERDLAAVDWNSPRGDCDLGFN